VSRTALGLGCAVAGAAVFSLNDVVIKFLSGDYPLHQIILTRSLVALAVVVGVLMPFLGGLRRLRTRRLGAHMLRAALVVLSNFFYFTALPVLPLAEAVAIFFVAPLLITAFSVVILGEKVGPRRWAAVAVGLLGVIVVLRPGTEAFQPASLFVLMAACCYAGMQMFTRQMGGTESAVTFAFYIQITFVMTSAMVGLGVGDGRYAGDLGASLEFLLRPWVMPETRDLALMALVGVASGTGGYLISQAYRLVEAGLVAPFEYVALPMAVVWGIVVFGDWPDRVAWIGICLIVGAGLYTLWRETRVRR